jgi:hypothetical protein
VVAGQDRIEKQVAAEVDLLWREAVAHGRQGCLQAADAGVPQRLVAVVQRPQPAGVVRPQPAGVVRQPLEARRAVGAEPERLVSGCCGGRQQRRDGCQGGAPPVIAVPSFH